MVEMLGQFLRVYCARGISDRRRCSRPKTKMFPDDVEPTCHTYRWAPGDNRRQSIHHGLQLLAKWEEPEGSRFGILQLLADTTARYVAETVRHIPQEQAGGTGTRNAQA